MKKKTLWIASSIALLILIATVWVDKTSLSTLSPYKVMGTTNSDTPNEPSQGTESTSQVSEQEVKLEEQIHEDPNPSTSAPVSSSQAPAPKTAPKPTPKPATAPATQPSPTSGTQASSEKQKMLNLINSERAKGGLAPLKLDTKVTEVAQIKSGDMAKNNYFSHTSPSYGSPFDMLRKFGVSFTAAAENIALNVSVDAAHSALMASEGHRTNIMNPNYTSIGIGVSDSPRGKIFVQMFIRK